MTYQFEITETLQRQIEVEAESEEEAFHKVSELYRIADIILDSRDYVDTSIELMQQFPGSRQLGDARRKITG